MHQLLLLILISISFQNETSTISPDGKFKLTIEVKEESDLRRDTLPG
jgi:hypothetical protein